MTTSSKPQSNSPLMLEALAQKDRTRDNLSNLPFKEKYNMIVAMQRRSAAIHATRSETRIIWPDWID